MHCRLINRFIIPIQLQDNNNNNNNNRTTWHHIPSKNVPSLIPPRCYHTFPLVHFPRNWEPQKMLSLGQRQHCEPLLQVTFVSHSSTVIPLMTHHGWYKSPGAFSSIHPADERLSEETVVEWTTTTTFSFSFSSGWPMTRRKTWRHTRRRRRRRTLCVCICSLSGAVWEGEGEEYLIIMSHQYVFNSSSCSCSQFPSAHSNATPSLK